MHYLLFFFFFQAEDGIRDYKVTGVQTCALPICYFVRVEAVSSVRPVRTEVRLVNETDGRRLLAQSRLVGATPALAGAPRAQPPAPVAAPPRAAPRAQPSPHRPAEPGGDWSFALIAKGGAFKR